MSVYGSYNDQELILLLKEDNQEAMTEIYDRYWLKLLSVATNRLSFQEEAEECVQDVFLSLWKRRNNIVLKHALSTYLWIAVKYQVINRLDKRHARRNLQTTQLMDDGSVPSPEVYLLEKELMERIELSVRQLPEKCRMVYRLSREDGKSNKEISAEMNISEKTVEGHITKALKDIRTDLMLVVPAFMVCSILNDVHNKF
jgi:RNA polymerase sigma-70 factor (family 1)